MFNLSQREITIDNTYEKIIPFFHQGRLVSEENFLVTHFYKLFPKILTA